MFSLPVTWINCFLYTLRALLPLPPEPTQCLPRALLMISWPPSICLCLPLKSTVYISACVSSFVYMSVYIFMSACICDCVFSALYKRLRFCMGSGSLSLCFSVSCLSDAVWLSISLPICACRIGILLSWNPSFVWRHRRWYSYVGMSYGWNFTDNEWLMNDRRTMP